MLVRLNELSTFYDVISLTFAIMCYRSFTNPQNLVICYQCPSHQSELARSCCTKRASSHLYMFEHKALCKCSVLLIIVMNTIVTVVLNEKKHTEKTSLISWGKYSYTTMANRESFVSLRPDFASTKFNSKTPRVQVNLCYYKLWGMRYWREL